MNNIKIVLCRDKKDTCVDLLNIINNSAVLPTFDSPNEISSQYLEIDESETLIIPVDEITKPVVDYFIDLEIEQHNIILVINYSKKNLNFIQRFNQEDLLENYTIVYL
jgi:hypothetical protein